jgi:hypothetical protein
MMFVFTGYCTKSEALGICHDVGFYMILHLIQCSRHMSCCFHFDHNTLFFPIFANDACYSFQANAYVPLMISFY